MQRNQLAHFSTAPSVGMDRSMFGFADNKLTSFDSGKLYPVFYREILPGDTFELNAASTVRMQTPVFPVMDNAYMDTYFFFVPNRLTWNKWKEFCGENNTSAWDDPNVEYNIPQVAAPAGGFVSGSLADHFGMPLYVSGIKVSELPFRAYRLIWNRWFRNQNVQDPLLVNLGNNSSSGNIANAFPERANRFRDYFSSSLPAPQKGAPVTIPLDGSIPVLTRQLDLEDADNKAFLDKLISSPTLRWFMDSPNDPYPYNLMTDDPRNIRDSVEGLDVGSEADTALQNPTSEPVLTGNVKPSNLYASLSDGTGYATVNALRQAFAVQRILEKDARGGTRYAELLRAHFNVIAPDASLQEPEYLGGQHVMINMDQVIQVSNSSDTPLGNTGAYSKTNSSDFIFRKSFAEHGMLIGLACIRTDRSYQQGIPRSFLRKTRYDFYWPSLAHIGEQAVKLQEIFAFDPSSDQPEDESDYPAYSNDPVFGYQEAFVEYRVGSSSVSGMFRNNYKQLSKNGYSRWHYGDWYSSRPFLSDEWMQEDDKRLANTLAISDADKAGLVDYQFIANFFFNVKAARCMPLYSFPGLIDHF